jgi:hypothetical protein
VNPDIPSPARIWNAFLGGKDNISQVVSVTPHSDPTVPIQARHSIYSRIALLAVT